MFGGYASVKWKPASSGDQMFRDDKAFVFNVRSNKAYPLIIADIEQDHADNALCSYKSHYLMWGGDWTINVDRNGFVHHWRAPRYYKAPIQKTAHLMGGSNCEKVVDIEIFQLL